MEKQIQQSIFWFPDIVCDLVYLDKTEGSGLAKKAGKILSVLSGGMFSGLAWLWLTSAGGGRCLYLGTLQLPLPGWDTGGHWGTLGLCPHTTHHTTQTWRIEEAFGPGLEDKYFENKNIL